MKVLFGFSVGQDVHSVYWKNAAGEVMHRVLRTDGSIVDQTMTNSSLYWVMNRISSSQYWMYPAEVTDVRTAFKYLGKDPKFVEVLPEASIDPSE